MDLFLSVYVLLFDEMGKVLEQFLTTFDIIIWQTRNSNVYIGGCLTIFLCIVQRFIPQEVLQFLNSYHIISCFKMIELENSIQASNYAEFKNTRFNYQKFSNEPDIVNEFFTLCSRKFTSVNDRCNSATSQSNV